MSKSNTTYITSIPAAHMSAQIRTKQLATKSTQEKLNAAIIKKFQEMQDISGEALTKQIAENLSGWLELVKGVNVLFSPKEEESPPSGVSYFCDSPTIWDIPSSLVYSFEEVY